MIHTHTTHTRTSKRLSTLLAGFLFGLVAVLVVWQVQAVSAATLNTASLTLSDPRPSATSVTYDLLASNVTTTAIQCLRFEFDTAADGSGGKPTNLTLTGATFSGDYVPTPASWTVTNNNTTGITTVTFGSGETPGGAASRNAILSGITNGNTAGDDYYLLFSTYNNTDCSTSPVDSVTVGFIYTDGQAVTVSVAGSLSFAVAGVTGNGSATVNGATITNGLATTSTTIPFGTVTSSANKVAAQDITVSTNSGSGYSVYTRFTGDLTAGSNTISNHSGSNASPSAFSAAGTEAFGYTTEDATLTGTADRFTSSGGNKWAAFTTSNAEVIYNAAAVSSQTTRLGFQVGIASTTEPGAYTSTVVYTAVPIY